MIVKTKYTTNFEGDLFSNKSLLSEGAERRLCGPVLNYREECLTKTIKDFSHAIHCLYLVPSTASGSWPFANFYVF